MTDLLTGIATDEARVRADDRAHVFHSWSAQALIDPLPIASARG
ncbi:MAG: taurine---2-oxoglutarate transaminase, partial [Pseudonocardiales bacterium]|nr:taurine---2-oxoglutarate transaminase [Pseudonocardiales bacterium]